jgi:hypothetical protein
MSYYVAQKRNISRKGSRSFAQMDSPLGATFAVPVTAYPNKMSGTLSDKRGFEDPPTSLRTR